MKITCFGEVLWDIFPKHKKIGGAPLNVALRLKSMGIDSCVVSRVGDDDLGKDIMKYVAERQLPLDTFQIDHQYKTGEVEVTLDEENTATYNINHPVAWDFIEYTEEVIQVVAQSDAIIFGSLASRNETSRATLLRALDKAKFKILDVNLRPPHYDAELLLELMKNTDFIKLNDEELDEICTIFKIEEKSIENKIKAVAKHCDTDQICITKGGKGAILWYKGTFYHNEGYKIKVVDTVGAGDSFLATLISGLLQQETPQVAIDNACAVGAMVAAREGANPVFSTSEIRNFVRSQVKY
ncbi:carbohydrate kinase family protein [Aquimarina algiphila]|uniref:carbohydrate kinase family protein n=1 Tax=Aquimarina algiphila TaxID=2047982 RepID=UPI00232F630A|nr:carbohydrate kinase [Aquimarina algiphila]